MNIPAFAFLDLTKIAATPDRTITARNLMDHFGVNGDVLIKAGALAKHSNLNAVDDQSDYEGRMTEVVRKNGKNVRFSQTTGWSEVDPLDITVYRVNADWIVQRVKTALGLSPTALHRVIMDDQIWELGDAWLNKAKHPIIFVAHVRKSAVFDRLQQFLREKHSKKPALVLAMDMQLPSLLQVHGQSRIVLMQDAVILGSEEFVINTQLLAETMGGHVSQNGFSPGFRSLHVNGKTYSFSGTEASVLEVMDKAGKPMHKSEILAQSESKQESMSGVFRKNGKYNPAWGEIIKNDKKGLYWLEY